jgi:polysaccharide pyruvyl transferase WcaK-like protein
MDIHDVTHLFHDNPSLSNYYFNGSLLPVNDTGLFALFYRNITHNIKKKYHPWSVWNYGYQIFKKERPDLVAKNKQLMVNHKLYTEAKYRTVLGKDKVVSLNRKYDKFEYNKLEYDSTGMALIQYNSRELDPQKSSPQELDPQELDPQELDPQELDPQELDPQELDPEKSSPRESMLNKVNSCWTLISKCDDIFGGEMNQDLRVSGTLDNLTVTYNGFFRDGDELHVKMLTRTLKYNTKRNLMYMGAEREMFQTGRRVEKNCCYDPRGHILYNFRQGLEVITSEGKYISIKSPLLQELKDPRILFSISTPSIQYGENFLALGHIKINYKELYNGNNPVNKFVRSLNQTGIHAHGKYIYLMFFYEYDKDFKLISMSNAFIPEENHKPYYLVMAMSLACVNNKYFIGYGEGDIKLKIAILSSKKVKSMLRPIEQLNQSNYGFELHEHIDIQHIGYFGSLNCGDDAFVEVFKCLNKQFYPNLKCLYSTESNCIKDIKLNILGGGDVINSYFLSKMKHIKNLHAVGVGIPYMDQVQLVDQFKSLSLRYIGDLEVVSKINPSVVSFPDLVFLFDRFISRTKLSFKSSRPRIGFSLCRTYYHFQYELEYMNFLEASASTIEELIEKGFDIYLIPFGISNSDKENDRLVTDQLLTIVNSPHLYDATLHPQYSKVNYVLDTLNLINSMQMMVCSRFHSHVYSIICRVPFVSWSCSRKCKNLMIEYNLEDFYLPMKVTKINTPDVTESISSQILNVYSESEHSILRLDNLMLNINLKLDLFIKYWINLIVENS